MSVTAKDIMTTDVLSVRPSDSIEKVASILMENKISGLPVVNDEGSLVGLISEGDLVFQNKKISPPAVVDILGALIIVGSQEKYYEDIKRTLASNVESLMINDVITVNPEQTIEELASMMIDKNVNRLPVIDGDKLVGIVTRHDLIGAMHKR
jgi:CBS domain-containing protein